MAKIILETVKNGIIKTVIDPNYNGSGKQIEEVTVSLTPKNVKEIEIFLESVCNDLGLSLIFDGDLVNVGKITKPKIK